VESKQGWINDRWINDRWIKRTRVYESTSDAGGDPSPPRGRGGRGGGWIHLGIQAGTCGGASRSILSSAGTPPAGILLSARAPIRSSVMRGSASLGSSVIRGRTPPHPPAGLLSISVIRWRTSRGNSFIREGTSRKSSMVFFHPRGSLPYPPVGFLTTTTSRGTGLASVPASAPTR
jgi:hypothetical protein